MKQQKSSWKTSSQKLDLSSVSGMVVGPDAAWIVCLCVFTWLNRLPLQVGIRQRNRKTERLWLLWVPGPGDGTQRHAQPQWPRVQWPSSACGQCRQWEKQRRAQKWGCYWNNSIFHSLIWLVFFFLFNWFNICSEYIVFLCAEVWALELPSLSHRMETAVQPRRLQSPLAEPWLACHQSRCLSLWNRWKWVD